LRFISHIILVLIVLIFSNTTAKAQAETAKFKQVLEQDFKLIQRSSVKTIKPILDKIQASEFKGASEFLTKWQDKELWFRKADNQFFYVTTEDKKTYKLFEVINGGFIAAAEKKEIKQIKPNSGVRGLLAASLVQFRLSDPDLEIRRTSLKSLERDPKPEHLEALRLAIDKETNADLSAELQRLERLLTVQFDPTEQARIEAIKSFSRRH